MPKADPEKKIEIEKVSRMKTCIVVWLIIFFTHSLQAQKQATTDNREIVYKSLVGFEGIRGQVLDVVSREPLSARVEVRDSTGKVQASYYDLYPGIFTEEDGTFQVALLPGKYTLHIAHGIDYLSQQHSLEVNSNEGVQMQIYLKPWVNLKAKGWINGDGHAHLYSDQKWNDTMTRQVRKICMAQGVDFICAAQGWAGYDDQSWKQGYAKVSDHRFQLYYGAEMPKYRTSHAWWIGLKSTNNFFGHLIDSTYETKYFQTSQNKEWDFSWLKFHTIPDVEVIPRIAKTQKALAVIAHPTSWWWQERGDISKYTTNAVSNLSFGLLAGNIWGGMAVMGYMNDNYYYQNIWFNILNQGYTMPPLAELDGGYPRDNKFYYGSKRTYYHIDSTENGQTIDKITQSLRKGHTFVTSGPIIFATIDNKYQVGDIVPLDSQPHHLSIEAHASGEEQDYLSYVIVFRNGKIHTYWDLRKQKPRQFQERLTISEKEKAWYVVKAYGRNAWQDPKDLDVVAYCKRAESKPRAAFPAGKYDVGFTSPFYFRQDTAKQPAPLMSKVKLTVTSPESGKPVKNCTIDIMLLGEKIQTVSLTHGKGEFTMPVNAMIRIHADNYPTIQRGLYLDYLPYLTLLEKLGNGKWMEANNWHTNINEGQVPWEAFGYVKTKEILSQVNWQISMLPNERDNIWANFNEVFR